MTRALVVVGKNSRSVMENNSMDEKVFQGELAMCRKLHHEQKGCNWGKCATCGVIPALYKLHKGIILEKEDEIRRVKEEVFGESI